MVAHIYFHHHPHGPSPMPIIVQSQIHQMSSVASPVLRYNPTSLVATFRVAETSGNEDWKGHRGREFINLKDSWKPLADSDRSVTAVLVNISQNRPVSA